MSLSKKPEVKHIFFITDILTWQVLISRYVLVSETEKSVTIIMENGKHKRMSRSSDQGHFVDTFEAAKKKANEMLKERKKKVKEIQAKIKSSEDKIKARQIHDVVPMDVSKIKSSQFKF